MQILNEWQQIVNERFFELNETTLQDILTTFHELIDQSNLGDLDLLPLISSCSHQIQMPMISKCTDEEISQYTTLINQLIPNLASESSYVQVLTLSFLPRLAVLLTSSQLTDLITNIITTLQIYTQSNMTLSSISAIICLYTIVNDILLKFDNLHISTIQILKEFFKLLKKQKYFNIDQIVQESSQNEVKQLLDDPLKSMTASKLTQSHRQLNLCYTQELLTYEQFLFVTILKIFQAQSTQQLAKADDVSLLQQILSELITTIKCFQFKSQQIYTNLLQLLQLPVVIQSLMRCPNYLSALISYTATQLIDNKQSGKTKNLFRGFLTALFTTDWFLGEDSEDVINILKCDLNEGLNKIKFRKIVEKCYNNYCINYGVPVKAIVPVRVEI